MAKKEKKTKKHDTFIDMTAMSDMTVLLLTFFMLTATFLPLEPIQVNAPSSVSETKIPEVDNLMILIDPQGKIFLNLSETREKAELLDLMGERYNITFTPQQRRNFEEQATFAGVPMKEFQEYLSKDMSGRNEMARKSTGVPNDSVNNELELWVRYARSNNKQLTISIKADQHTPYDKVDDVMKTLVRIKENRYNLVTSLAAMPEGL